MEATETISREPAAVEGAVVNDESELGHADPSNDKSNEPRGVKRPAEDDIENDDRTPRDTEASQPASVSGEAAPMTKGQLKKLKRRERWEGNAEDRRQKRRDKRHQRQARRRLEKEEEIAAAAAEGREPALNTDRPRHTPSARVPVAVVVDCQFEKYMNEAELISLSSQVTRCYSDNKGAQHPVHLSISSYGGYLKERNETVLRNQHLKWKGVSFCEGDFVEAASEARKSMTGPKGGQVIEFLKPKSSGEPISLTPLAPTNMKRAKSAPKPEPEADDVDKSVVYLTADSPYTLDRLEPNTSYVIGGIIDKNREKGLCYRIAREKNVRTAKLPIGEYMVLQHRHVLATNHVLEIMLKWLETGDWGTAFMSVIPTRKGGKLKTDETTPIDTAGDEAVEEPGDVAVENDVLQADAAQVEAQDNRGIQTANTEAEVEGDNAEEGLTKNSLSEPRWSAPPLELETATDDKEKPTNDIAS
ncbi:tRNA-methyltransferase-domain-containing protein [Xylaria palmicola]|nr:tRNA-methyltransferase-domain-containing protein [Xylaria palmicola]